MYIHMYVYMYIYIYLHMYVCIYIYMYYRYEGYYLKDKMHGHGVYMWPDGRKYNGEYKNNLKHGQVHKGFGFRVDGCTYDGWTA